ncbi:MAG TPA: preprotein translocase subunit SecA, partial [Longimicrobiales bacterium]|nr:preprotein translocase subunit SecA [Longimicrobiales bacterium]
MAFQDMFKKLFGDRYAREVKKLQPIVDEINEIADRLQSVSEEELKGQTEKFRSLISERTASLREELDATRETKRKAEDAAERDRLNARINELDDEIRETIEVVLEELLPEAFATVKEASRRLLGTEIEFTGTKATWDMVPYDVQLIGGIALHRGMAAEMATGEGKTLVATMPLYLNALAGRGAHLVTVNTYLAQRDAEWMGTVYNYLGLTVDVIDLHQPGTAERRAAYAADITYGTNNEFGFDYLRDNMVHTLEQRVQRQHAYVIIDEVDSILIDEARTPLIISGPVGQEQSEIYKRYNPSVSQLFRKQTKIVSELIAEAEQLLEEGNSEAAGDRLLAAKRGGPKNKRLLKLFADDPGLQKLVQQTEAQYMREKRLYEVDEMMLFAMDEKGHNVHLSDKGLDTLSPNDPEAFVVPDISVEIGQIEKDEDLDLDEKRDRIQALEKEFAEKSQRIHAIHQLLKAYTLFNRDEQYIVEDGAVVIVDEFTGRKMAGRRWSDGLHQAVEAKENVGVRGETQTLATITIQNYFRMYDKLAGMTGTAETEEGEFHQIYDLDVMVIPTNRPVIRDDRQDLIYRTKREKYNALLDSIERLHRLELPVLVGTASVDTSETLSRMLKRRGIPHNVLNAKYHEQEARIVAEAGQLGGVTIATNMAGRGTDIKLGEGVKEPRTVAWARAKGLDLEQLESADPNRWKDLSKQDDDFVIEPGGLHILGSERHESRRIDRQLRGRAGRQGDPGASQFYLSLEDDLMRLFMTDRVAGIMEKLGAEEGEVITHALVTKSIERAQRRVETQNFEARKRLLDYDDVMNQQREVIYDLRLFALEGGEDLKGEVREMTETAIRENIIEFTPDGVRPEQWDLAGLRQRLALDNFMIVPELPEENDPEHGFSSPEEIEEMVLGKARAALGTKFDEFGEHEERILSWILLSVIDEKWRDHLYDLDHLKASIGFRGWGQKDPLVEYKQDAYEMFVDLMHDVRKSVSGLVFRAQLAPRPAPTPQLPQNYRLSGPSDTP